MTEDDAYEFKSKVLETFKKLLDGPLPEINVGVLADKNSRDDSNTNAAIGAKHEFGEDGLPIRSFLRMPMYTRYVQAVEKSQFFNKPIVDQVIAEKSFLPIMKKFGIIAEGVVLDAFETGGFGQWKPSIMEFKKTKQTLVETTQLERSISSEVVQK